MSELTIEPLSDEQKTAMRELRFVTTNREQSWALGMTADLGIAQRTGLAIRTYQPQQATNPSRQEYEVVTARPDIIREIRLIMDERDAPEAVAA